MRIEQNLYSLDKGWELSDVLSQQERENVSIVFAFGGRTILEQSKGIEDLGKIYPGAEIVGCSTAGEILSTNLYDEKIVATAIAFDKTTVKAISVPLDHMDESYEKGREIARQLAADDLVHVVVFSEGLLINGSALAKGLNEALGDKVGVTGGLAADQDAFDKTVIIHNHRIVPKYIVGIGFYGSNLKIGYGSKGGWDSFGVDREITHSEGNILYELDHQPALDLYKKYLGEHASTLPYSALLFPLSIHNSDLEVPLVRTVLAIDEGVGSMTFAGDMPKGEIARLMKSNYNQLLDGAIDAAEMASIDEKPDFALLISCVGRKLVLKQRTEEELEQVRDIFGQGAVLMGFYSYGELCPVRPWEKNCELHNQTMTITTFKEL